MNEGATKFNNIYNTLTYIFMMFEKKNWQHVKAFTIIGILKKKLQYCFMVYHGILYIN